MPLGLQPLGLGVPIRQITRAHDTTITYTSSDHEVFQLILLETSIQYLP